MSRLGCPIYPSPGLPLETHQSFHPLVQKNSFDSVVAPRIVFRVWTEGHAVPRPFQLVSIHYQPLYQLDFSS